MRPISGALYGDISGLSPKREYAVICYAVSAFAVESQPISIDFVTN